MQDNAFLFQKYALKKSGIIGPDVFIHTHTHTQHTHTYIYKANMGKYAQLLN